MFRYSLPFYSFLEFIVLDKFGVEKFVGSPSTKK